LSDDAYGPNPPLSPHRSGGCAGGQVQRRGVRRRRGDSSSLWFRRSVPPGWPPVLSVSS